MIIYGIIFYIIIYQLFLIVNILHYNSDTIRNKYYITKSINVGLSLFPVSKVRPHYNTKSNIINII